MKLLRFVGMATAFAIAVLAGSAKAEALATPDGATVLTVTGAITQTNDAGSANFDLEMLAAMGVTTIETTTIWTDGVQTFEGVALDQLLQALGATEGTLIATAINDYSVEIPIAEVGQGNPIVAFRQNGAEMSVRDKGPLWIVYDYDSDPAYRTETIYARSIWQLDRLEVRQ